MTTTRERAYILARRILAEDPNPTSDERLLADAFVEEVEDRAREARDITALLIRASEMLARFIE